LRPRRARAACRPPALGTRPRRSHERHRAAAPPPPDASCRPDNAGILAAEVDFPSTTVSAAALEAHDGAAPGKHTAGLGQEGLTFCGGREDAESMALSALSRLLRQAGAKAGGAGRLEVGSKSGPSASTSVKSPLVQVLLAEDPAAAGVLGAGAVHSCFGGSQAPLNATDWAEGAAWGGRCAAVAASDAALYVPGPARPTSGAGAAGGARRVGRQARARAPPPGVPLSTARPRLFPARGRRVSGRRRRAVHPNVPRGARRLLRVL
jgi:hypothetical protein